MDRVKGKVAIITGASTGLGKAQALCLAGEGAKVVVADINETDGKNVVEGIRRENREAIFHKHDVTREQDWQSLIQRTMSEFGRLDVLVNNAGVMLRKGIEDISLEEWRWVMGVNIDGVFLGTKHAIKTMKKTGGGSIINISSIAGVVGLPLSSPYTASKGAVRLFTKAAAIECSKSGLDYNIRVNSVHPGFIMTEMFDGILRADAERTGSQYEDLLKLRTDLTPMGQMGDPEDVANAVLFLASDESKYTTGTELMVDGGYTAR